MEKYDLAIDVFNEDQEGFRATMNVFIPLEVWGDRKINA
jgi:hypothetical protein